MAGGRLATSNPVTASVASLAGCQVAEPVEDRSNPILPTSSMSAALKLGNRVTPGTGC